MNTPICDFAKRYNKRQPLRLHMPGHKGLPVLGMEPLDITEIAGADSLYEASGIIRQSEENAGRLFGCKTFYSTEGSSQCIRAMLYLALMYAKARGRKPLIAAARNVHKTFLSAVALLDFSVTWLPSPTAGYLSCTPDAAAVETSLLNAKELPVAVYLTSPDYLGMLSNIAEIAEVCHRYGVLLLVDNAHGAYLKFLNKSLHPIDLGADICCDSAHKTLPVLTGGAYLHLAPSVSNEFDDIPRDALALFGSTSPSYLILQSLDAVNPYLLHYPEKLQSFLPSLKALRQRLISYGYQLYGDEPLKLTVETKPFGYLGTELAALLTEQGIVCEFSDPDYLVMMISPELGQEGIAHLEQALFSIPARTPILETAPVLTAKQSILSVRGAMLAPSEIIDVSQSLGRILSAPSVGCPPAVPILVCGEQIDSNAISCFQYYGIRTCHVVK